MVYKKIYTGYLLIGLALLVLIWLMLESRQRTRQLEKTLHETTLNI